MINKETIKRVVESADLMRVAQEMFHVKLTRSGASWKGLSPLQDEKTPSFFINPETQRFKCFSSGYSGDAIDLVRYMDALEFPEAVRKIANHFNIPLEDEQTPEFSERTKLITAVKSLQNIYRNALSGSPAEGYLHQRFGEALTEKFELGYQPLDCDKKLLRQSGMLTEKGYPLTKGRAMFPIRNPSGVILSFTGRRLDDEKKAKYINGYTTSIYDKSDAIYGEFESFRNIIRLNWGIIVEGNPDVIAGHFKNAHSNTVAAMGTSLSDTQAKRLSRYAKNWTIFTDGDKAGIKAVVRIAEPLLKEGLNLTVQPLGEGMDPFDYWSANNKFELTDCQDFFEYFKDTFGIDENIYGLISIYLTGIKDRVLKQSAARRLCRLLDIGFIRVQEDAKTFKVPDEPLGELTQLIERTWKDCTKNVNDYGDKATPR